MRYQSIIEELRKKGSSPGLEAIGNLLEELGHPERKLPIIHIAGTNGKGSVFAFLSSILKEGGYRVGRYISPTIQCYEERFQINGDFIEEKQLEKYFFQIQEAIGILKEKGKKTPTLFEAETAVAFLYFMEENVDFALIETGMGGRLDATNIVEHPVLTLITSISFDHRDILGDSLPAIAGEKAGIIKAGVPVICAKNPPQVIDVIKEKAKKEGAPFFLVEREDVEVIEEGPEGNTFLWKKQKYHMNLPGSHQIDNACLALAAAEQIKTLRRQEEQTESIPVTGHIKAAPAGEKQRGKEWPVHCPLDTETMARGIEKTKWPGRLEIIGRNPLFYRDGAHNLDGAGKLAAFVQKHFTNKRIIYIMGVLKDKDYPGMLAFLMPLAKRAYVFRPDCKRGLKAELLAEEMQKYPVAVTVCQDIKDAVRKARAEAEKEDILVACGSLSFMEDMEVLP